MKSYQLFFSLILLLASSIAASITPKYHGFDGSYIEIGEYKQGTQHITMIVDDAPFHFKLEAGLNAGSATSEIALSFDDIEFAVGYIDNPITIKGEKHYFEYVDLVALWDSEALNIRSMKFTVLPPYGNKSKTKKLIAASAKSIKEFNKMTPQKKYLKFEGPIDNATATAWNKPNRIASKKTAAAPVAVTPAKPVNPSVDPELQAKLDAAKKAKNTPVIATPAKAAEQSNSYLATARNAIPKGHIIEDESTRKLLGYTLLATGVVTGFQTIFAHQAAAAHNANYNSMENLANIDPNQRLDPLFVTIQANEANSKAKQESNRNLAAVISIISFVGGTVVLNF